MTPGETLARIESRLNEIEQLATDQRLAVVDALIEVRYLLAANLTDAAGAGLDRQNDLSGRYLLLARPIADALWQQCHALLHSYEGSPSFSDIAQCERDVQRARQQLEQIVNLLPDYPTETTTEAGNRLPLQVRVEALARRVQSAQRRATAQREVNDLWQRAEKLIGTDHARGIDLYRQAHDTATAALQSGEVAELDADALAMLRADARQRYDDIRARFEFPTTRALVDDIVALIVDFAHRVERNPTEEVFFFQNDTFDAVGQVMPVQQALEIARQRLVNLAWRGKIEEYIASAERELDLHEPRKARAALQAWEALPGLYDDRVGVKLPRNLEVRIDRVRKRIEPEVHKLETAEQQLNQARLETDVLKADTLWQAARDTYPHLAQLAAVRQTIVERAHARAEQLLGEIEQHLRYERWSLCASRLKQVAALLQLDTSLELFQDRYLPLQQVYDDVLPLTRRGQERLCATEERERLEELQQQYVASYWEGWPGLQQRLTELQARTTLQMLLEAVDQACGPTATLDLLEGLERRCREMQADASQGSLHQPELDQALKRLEAWSGYVQARDELDTLITSSKPTDTPALLRAPDLAVVRAGIQAAMQDPQRQAQRIVREQQLSERLQELTHNDDLAHGILERSYQFLRAPTLENLRQVLRWATFWLSKPTSYRAAFLDVRRDVREELLRQLEQAARQQLAAAHARNYADLNLAELEALRSEAAGLEGTLEPLVAGPVAAARAHSAEQQAYQGQIGWETVKQAWESAMDLLMTDLPLRAYCAQRARQAYKQSEFIRVAHERMPPEAAEKALRKLCDDPLLRGDGEVWLRHGQHCLQGARQHLRAAQELEPVQQALRMIGSARESLNRAHELLTDRPDVAPEARAVPALLHELKCWERVGATQHLVLSVLRPGAGRLNADTCQQARTAFDNVHSFLEQPTPLPDLTGEPHQVITRFWQTQATTARNVLETQLVAATEVFDQIDSLLGIHYLAPHDELIRTRLVGQVVEAIQTIRAESADTIFDYAGRKLLAWFARSRGEVPQDRDIPQLQLDAARRLMGKMSTLQRVLEVLPGQLPALNSELRSFSLEHDRTNLQSWVDQLRQFQQALELALSLAEAGLRTPRQFAKVRYILIQGGSDSIELIRVPAAFKDQQHPAYRSASDYLITLERKRERQEQLRNQIEHLLHLLQDGDETALLERADQALALMHTMQTEEPTDPCGLQATLVYNDLDQHQRYTALVPIAAWLQTQRDQIRVMRQWLARFTDSAVVNWAEAKVRIEQMRATCQLTPALELLRQLRMGENDEGTIGGRWSLQKAYENLSATHLLEQLRSVTALPPQPFPAFVQRIDAERERLRQWLGQQVQECQECETFIEKLQVDASQKWRDFWDYYIELLNEIDHMRNWSLHRSKCWTPFEQAARNFGRVCPVYAEFQKALREVFRRTRIEPPFLHLE